MERKRVVLSQYDQALLRRCNNEFLDFLIFISEHKDFKQWQLFISEAEDIEKNLFFAEKEDQMSAELLSIKHAYSRGKIGGMKQIIYLAYGAKDELARRVEVTKRKLEEKKIQEEQK